MLLQQSIDQNVTSTMHFGDCTICSNFNNFGCSVSKCCYLHSSGHFCPARPHIPTKQLRLTISIKATKEALKNYPKPYFINFSIKGFSWKTFTRDSRLGLSLIAFSHQFIRHCNQKNIPEKKIIIDIRLIPNNNSLIPRDDFSLKCKYL